MAKTSTEQATMLRIPPHVHGMKASHMQSKRSLPQQLWESPRMQLSTYAALNEQLQPTPELTSRVPLVALAWRG